MSSLGRLRVVPPAESEALFDTAHLRDVIGFVFRAVGRHRLLSALVFVLTLALGAWWMVVAPRTYHVEAKLLASRSQQIRSLGNPRTVGDPFEDPTRAAEETVFARDNLLSLIKQTRLMESVEQNRPLLTRALRAGLAFVVGPPKPEDDLDALVLVLEKRLRVTTDAQTVVISIDWPQAQPAYQVVETAQQNFLEARHVAEMTAISEALSILQVHAAGEQKSVADALQELERVRELRRGGLSTTAPAWSEVPQTIAAAPAPLPVRAEPSAATDGTEQELAQLKFLYHSKRRALADLEEFRARRLSELNAQLSEQRVQYADRHPAVADTIQRVAAMAQPSPQMAQVRQDVAELLAEYRRRGGQNPEGLVEPTRRAAAPLAKSQSQRVIGAADLADDPEVEFARNNLRIASATAEELAMRIDSARIEQDTARAAFKYRYSIVRPAALPKTPIKPDLPTLAGLTLATAFILALVSGAALERWRGVIVEPWQVTSGLGLPVLSEVRSE